MDMNDQLTPRLPYPQGENLRAHWRESWVDPRTSLESVEKRTNRLLSLIRHGPHGKRRVQQFFYCCVCIRYSCNVSTEPLPSNDRGIHRHTHRQQSDLISLLYFFKIRKVGEKCMPLRESNVDSPVIHCIAY
jgi:hypothetical protein